MHTMWDCRFSSKLSLLIRNNPVRPAAKPIAAICSHDTASSMASTLKGRELSIGTRRSLLLAAANIALAAALPQHALARPARRSTNSDVPAVLTVINGGEVTLKLYWLNFDGDSEFYTAVPPGETWTVDTYQTHLWRIVDASSQRVLQQYTVTAGEQVLQFGPRGRMQGAPEGLLDSQSPTTVSSSSRPDRQRAEDAGKTAVAEDGDPFACEGFDGIGGLAEDYAAAKVKEVVLGPGGGCASLQVEGYGIPLPILVGSAEAMTIVYANGVEFRRPPTVNTWLRTLQASGAMVDRVVVTRLVGQTFYARIVLTMPDGEQRGVDSRPSDGLALALQADTPLFVAKQIVEGYEEVVRQSHRGSKDLADLLTEDDSLQASAGLPLQGGPKAGPLLAPKAHQAENSHSLPMSKAQQMRSI